MIDNLTAKTYDLREVSHINDSLLRQDLDISSFDAQIVISFQTEWVATTKHL